VSASWTETLLRWRRERLPHALFLPAACTLALASAVGQPWSGWTATRILWAYVAVADLRLWDDLQDRHIDAEQHPERVSLDPVAGPLMVCVFVGVGALALTHPLVLALVVALAAFYRLRPSVLEPVLLLKYPVLVGLLRGAVDPLGAVAALLVYIGMLADARMSSGRVARLAVVALALLGLHALFLP
jgi:hypothetical protein